MLGDRQLSVLPVAISLMTSTMSGLSLLGSSSELYYSGPAYSFVIISMLLCGPITALTVLPVFYNLKELSLYNVSAKNIAKFDGYCAETLTFSLLPSTSNEDSTKPSNIWQC